jgi:hypothetical protein
VLREAVVVAAAVVVVPLTMRFDDDPYRIGLLKGRLHR